MFDPAPGVLIEGIDPKAVLVGVDDPEQPLAEKDPLGRAYQALEDRLLDALAEILTGLRGLPEPATPCGGRRRDVVGDQVEHKSTIDR